MSSDFDTGQRFGAYQLGKLLGRGGMGVVYQAQHVHLSRTVALKLLAPQLSENEDFRARFLRESRLAATLDHPGIVTIYDAGDVNGVLYIAMRFVRGTDLSAVIAQRGPLGIEETMAILDQVAAALDAAHAAGLVHRDVKPANVMIEGERCYLGDFGLTKRTSGDSMALTVAGQFLGTVDYVAPEQIEGGEQDGRTDVYALGCVLFECLTGSRPFPRDAQVAVLYAQLREDPPRASELRPDLPPAIDDVVARAMAKAPAGRFDTCREMVTAARIALTPPTLETAAPPPQVPTQEAFPQITAPAQAPPDQPPPRQPPPAPAPPAQAPPTPTAATSALPLPPLPPINRPRRGLALPLALIAAVVAAAVVVVLVSSSGGDNPATNAAKPNSRPPAADTSGPHVVDTIKVGDKPHGVLFRGDSLWVANSGDGTVTRVPTDGSKPTEITVGPRPYDVASNTDSVWAANSGSNTVSRIDAATGEASDPITVGDRSFFLTAQDDAVYVSNAGGDNVIVIDPSDGSQIGQAISVGDEPRGITTSQHAVWVANSGSNTVSRIVRGEVADTIDVEIDPENVAISNDAIWVTNTGSDSVSRIVASTTGTEVTNTKVGSKPYGLGFGEGYMWVTNSGEDTVMRLDPDTGKRVGAAIPVPGRPVGVAFADGAVWVTSNEAGTLSRIDP